MNLHKHMEAIFVATLAVAGAGTFALDSLAPAEASPAAPVLHALAATSAVPVVLVRAHRPAHRA